MTKPKKKTEKERLEERLVAMAQRISTADRRTGKALAMVEELKELIAGESLEKAKADAEAIHDAYRLANLKMVVLGELRYMLRSSADLMQVTNECIRSWDESDDWWLTRKNWVLGRWYDEMVQRCGSVADVD